MLNLKKNLISIGCLTKNEKVVAFSNKQCWIVNQRNKLTLAGHSDKKKKKWIIQDLHSPYTIKQATEFVSSNTTPSSDSKLIKLWHQRFGHLNYNSLNYLSRHNKVTSMIILNQIKTVCAQCLAGR